MIEAVSVSYADIISDINIQSGTVTELEKAFNENIDPAKLPELHNMKARIEFVGDFEDVKKVRQFIKQLSGS